MRQFGELEAVIMDRLWAWCRPAWCSPWAGSSRCDAGHDPPPNRLLLLAVLVNAGRCCWRLGARAVGAREGKDR
jgi:hypothetical protein